MEQLEIMSQSQNDCLEKPHVRQGWEESFHQMALNGDDQLLEAEALLLTEWEENEWQWEPNLPAK